MQYVKYYNHIHIITCTLICVNEENKSFVGRAAQFVGPARPTKRLQYVVDNSSPTSNVLENQRSFSLLLFSINSTRLLLQNSQLKSNKKDVDRASVWFRSVGFFVPSRSVGIFVTSRSVGAVRAMALHQRLLLGAVLGLRGAEPELELRGDAGRARDEGVHAGGEEGGREGGGGGWGGDCDCSEERSQEAGEANNRNCWPVTL